MQITGGRVTFGRTVQPAQYEGRRTEVELSFALEEGTSADDAKIALDKVAAMAKAKALELVKDDKHNAAAAAGVTVTAKDAADPKPDKTVAAASMNAKDAAKPTKTKEKPAATAGDELVEEKPQISTGAARVDPAQSADPDGLDDAGPPAAKTYTDKDLTDTVAKVNAVIKNPQAIKDVRAKYTDTPTAAIATITPDKRAAFVAEIEGLLAAHKAK